MASMTLPDGSVNPNYLTDLMAERQGNGSIPSPGDSSGMYGGGSNSDPSGWLSKLSGIFGGGGANSGGWLNGFGTVAKGLGDLGGLYLGIKQLGLAKDSFKLQKRAYNTNLANQTSAYNTQVGDRIAGRSYATEEERQAALRAAQLPTGG